MKSLLLFFAVFLLLLASASGLDKLSDNVSGRGIFGFENVSDFCLSSGTCLSSVSSGGTNLSEVSTYFVNRTDWTSIDDYPVSCNAGEFVSGLGDTLTCSMPIDTDTTYTAEGTYIYLNSTTFYINTTALDSQIGGADVPIAQENITFAFNNTPVGNNFVVGFPNSTAMSYRAFNSSAESYDVDNLTGTFTLAELNSLISDATLSEGGGGSSGPSNNLSAIFQDDVLPGYVFDFFNETANASVYRPQYEELSISCSGSYAGVPRYNYTNNTLQICDGTSWVSLT